MIISVNWLKQLVPNLPEEISDLSKLIGARLVEIESVKNLNEKYKDVIIAHVVSAEKIEGSNHLNLCKIDDGGVNHDVQRDENGLIQVVCGAPNMRNGLFVAWLPPKSIVPETFDKEQFKLGARKLMGQISNGMIASLRELDLGEEHDGILEINPEVFENGVQAGDSFAEKFELNDFLLEVENKSLTHRPDCFGIIGFAREVAGILGQKFENPSWYTLKNTIDNPKANFSIEIMGSEICQKYSAAQIDCKNIKASSSLTVNAIKLLKSGMRPIDEITDLANLLMLESGQPLHTFDFEKLKILNNGNPPKMTVRRAFKGEKLELLDGKEVEMTPEDIVIATGKNAEIAVALAGAMGGKSTAIDENTTQILVESATFNLYNLRNTQMRHGIFSEAITRFTKGQPANACISILEEFSNRISKIGGKQIGDFASAGEDSPKNPKISAKRTSQVLGRDFSDKEIQKTLQNVGFSIHQNGEFSAPFWRTDIHIEEDLIEEIGRLNGYDEISLSLPNRSFKPVKKAKISQLESEIRKVLSSAGANEVLTYSFIHGDLIKKINQNSENSYRIINSISPDLQFYRQTILPSLLSKVNSNIRNGFEEFGLFEINKITHKKLGLNSENVPNEQKKLGFVFSTNKKGGIAFYTAKYFANFLFEKLGLSEIHFKKFKENDFNSEFEPKRSATIILKSKNGKEVEIGTLGEFKKSVQKSLKLPETTAGFEINIDEICQTWGARTRKLRQISKFQAVKRDVTIQTSSQKKFNEVFEIFKQEAKKITDLQIDVLPLDIFRVDEEKKNFAFRFIITPQNRTLTGEEIHAIMSEFEKQSAKIDGKII